MNRMNSFTKGDLIGMSSFFDFFCSVLSRIAYTEAPHSLFLLTGVLKIIPKELMESLSKINNISELDQDESVLYSLPKNNIKTRLYKDKPYIDFIGYAEEINILIENTAISKYYDKTTDENIKILCLGDSNYGDVSIIGIKTIPNFVFTTFRGTYSSKTAQSYIQIQSIQPVVISEQSGEVKKMLAGIAKIDFEIMHSILEAKHAIATFLGKENIIPVFTGHSLGGAMATILTDEYCSLVKLDASQYKPMSPKPICITFGAPRVLSLTTSINFCKQIISGSLMVRRYSNHGDPITALPPPRIGFYHPCSSEQDKKQGYRKFVSRDCDSSSKASIKTMAVSDTTKAINCSNEPSSWFSKMPAVNILDHMTYLYISFAKAADMTHLFGKSVVIASEIERYNGDTVMRIVEMTGNSDKGKYNVNFIDLVNTRIKDGKTLFEDKKINRELFSYILSVQNVPDIQFMKDGKPCNNGLPCAFTKKHNLNILDRDKNYNLKMIDTEKLHNVVDAEKMDERNDYTAEVPQQVTGGKRRKTKSKKRKKRSTKRKIKRRY
jgi:hypothetical protein